jgi:serine phosphatase RsbU (regulator of sigma subunit)
VPGPHESLLSALISAGADNGVVTGDAVGVESFASAYQAALQEHAGLQGDDGLALAYELGRRAVVERLSLLDLAGIHGDALAATLRSDDSEPGERVARRAADFLREALATFEIALRGYAEMREVARIEHEHVLQLQAIADTALALKASGDPLGILRVAARRTREILGARAASASLSSRTTGPSSQIIAGEESLPERQAPSLSVGLSGAYPETEGTLSVWEPSPNDPGGAREAVLVQIAQLISAALATAEVLQTQREIADTLQRGLLPSALPILEGIELAARFCPAGNGIVVGGDFYDAFTVDAGGSSGVVIGDVCGKGPAAAALTALVRHTLRAALLVHSTPTGVLGLVNAAIRQQTRGELCTVLFGLLDRRAPGCVVRFATGGHPLPILVPADGPVRDVGVPGMLLGASDQPMFSDFEVSLDPGDLLVLYTDGVIEVRGGGHALFGPDHLMDVLQRCRGNGAQQVADRVADAALSAAGGPARDDIAVLVIRAGC